MILFIEGFNNDSVSHSNLILTGSLSIPGHVIRKVVTTREGFEKFERIIYLGHGEPHRWLVRNNLHIRTEEIPNDKEVISIACGTLFPNHNSIYFDETLIGVHWLSDMYPFIRKLLEYSFDPNNNLDFIYKRMQEWVEYRYFQTPDDISLLRVKRVMKRGKWP